MPGSRAIARIDSEIVCRVDGTPFHPSDALLPPLRPHLVCRVLLI